MGAQDILVMVEVGQSGVAGITHELLGGARQLATASGGQVVALVLSANGQQYAPDLGAADRILAVDDPQLAAYAPEPFLAVLEQVIRDEQPRVALIGSTSIGWDMAPLVAARLGVVMTVGCQQAALEGDAVKATASICGGKILADVRIEASPAVLMVLPGAMHAAESAGTARLETKASPVPLAPGAICFEELILPEAGDVDITGQDVLVGVGRGIQQEDNMELAEELADALGGVLAASRPVVDQGWLPVTRQVGKSGMTVKPKCFISLGTSGAPEHIEGMKDADLIVAVNTDSNAPIFDVAHYGVVADLVDLAPALTEAIQDRKRG